MLAAAAFCPCPPLLHPAVAVGAAPETDQLRRACTTVVAALVREVDVVVTVGPAPRTGWYPTGARGTLHGVGVDVELGRGPGAVELPLSLGLAAWLLDAAGFDGPSYPFGVAVDEEPGRCRSLGEGIAERGPRVGLLVMGDGSARRDPKAPGAFDPRAESLDNAVAEAIVAVDHVRLSMMDPAACTELMAAGRAPWQVAAGAAAARADVVDTKLRGTRHFLGAPYGVGYLVAGWHEHG